MNITSSGEQIPSGYAIPSVSRAITHEDAQEIIRLLKRIDMGIRHIESNRFNCVWGMEK